MWGVISERPWKGSWIAAISNVTSQTSVFKSSILNRLRSDHRLCIKIWGQTHKCQRLAFFRLTAKNACKKTPNDWLSKVAYLAYQWVCRCCGTQIIAHHWYLPHIQNWFFQFKTEKPKLAKKPTSRLQNGYFLYLFQTGIYRCIAFCTVNGFSRLKLNVVTSPFPKLFLWAPNGLVSNLFTLQ